MDLRIEYVCYTLSFQQGVERQREVGRTLSGALAPDRECCYIVCPRARGRRNTGSTALFTDPTIVGEDEDDLSGSEEKVAIAIITVSTKLYSCIVYIIIHYYISLYSI